MQFREVDALRAFTHDLLMNFDRVTWTVQGFGFIRTYLDPKKRFRLNVWHSALKVPNVSVVHDHPWHFTSWVLAGQLVNQRYHEHVGEPGAEYDYQRIKTGEGGGPEGGIETTRLYRYSVDMYTRGDMYSQRAEEIHATNYLDGTVTLNDRTPLDDGEHARVFWPHGQQWVDAIPRIARFDEISIAVNAALKIWDC